MSEPPAPSNGAPIYRLLGKPARRTRWMAGAAPLKSGCVETNPGPTPTHKQVWIYDICHIQIHGRKKTSIMCSMIEHWVHLICAGIRQEQYTDTCTCHLHIAVTLALSHSLSNHRIHIGYHDKCRAPKKRPVGEWSLAQV